MAKSPKELLAECRQKEIKAADLRFMDFPGSPKHFTVPIESLTEDSFESGFNFAASSMYGWQAINESDMLVVPQAETAFVDPFMANTIVLTGNIFDPVTKTDYDKDPRNVARKAEQYLKSSGIADVAQFGAEPEFFIFDDVRFDENEYESYYHIDSVEGQWNRGRRSGDGQTGQAAGYRVRYREGYFPLPPTDTLQEIRTEIMLHLMECGIPVETQHHEVATAGQCELDLRYGPLLTTADRLLTFKYIVKNVAAAHRKTATFMPKPLWNDNGSGLHLSLSLWNEGNPLFAGSDYGGLSKMAMHAMGGILAHAPALMAFCCPTTNSYKRLVPGFQAPINLTYSYRNRSAAIRIPVHTSGPEDRRFEFRLPDPAANPYLAMAAILMAAIDGIQNKTDPGRALDKDIYDLSPDETENVPGTPKSLEESLIALREDHEFLLRGDVFTEDVIDTWIWFKTEREAASLRERPHPHEFIMYYDV